MRYLPQTSHSIHFKIKATVRSLLWPGFVGYHRANSAIFGYTYIGSGIKNSDLPFLLWIVLQKVWREVLQCDNEEWLFC